MILIQGLTLAVLLALSAYFAAVESAITSLSAVRMKKLAFISPHLLPHFQEWLSNPHRLLSVLMVANNAVNVGFSSLAAVAAVPLHSRFSPGVVSWGVWVLATAALLVLGEIVPKIIGRVYRERVAEGMLPFLTRTTRALYWIWGPIGWALKKFAPGLYYAPVNPLTVVSLEELQQAVTESQSAGHLPEDSGDMFRRALTLSNRTVREVAQPVERMDALALEILDRPGGWDLFVDLLVETGRTRVPVTRGGRPVGYIHVMDLQGAVRSGSASRVEEMIRPLRWISPALRALDLMEEFRSTGEAIALVGSLEGDVLGLVTLEDVLEEIVGEILDEYDREEGATA